MSTTEPDNVRPLRRHPAEALADAWTADALMATDFPDPRWAVPGILAEGVNVLAGPPKVGKSWMSLGLALAVASGGARSTWSMSNPDRCSTSPWKTPRGG
ncbi:AAA family ATPase [Saccharopolyspora spinosporotrichia]